MSFVFKEDLISALSLPKFAGVWDDLLQLRSDSHPFQLVRTAQYLFGNEGELRLFAPTEREYLEGRVYRSSITDRAEKVLEDQGWALVLGQGASGKTTLALQIAFGVNFVNTPAYYLDLSSFTGDPTDINLSLACQTLASRADNMVLFIVDNVHLNESFARSLFDHWQCCAIGSRLLMIGRYISKGFDLRGVERPMMRLEASAIILQAGPEELNGSFCRIAERYTGATNNYQKPNGEVLSEWHKLFGGDLIAFSIAVTRRIKDLCRGEWHLGAEDIIDYIRETYLYSEFVSAEERLNLIRIAMLATVEVEAPSSILVPDTLDRSLQIGLVLRSERDAGMKVFFRLVHPGFGELLLKAADATEREICSLTKLAGQSLEIGVNIGQRLKMAGRLDDTISVLKSTIDALPALLDSAPRLQEIHLLVKLSGQLQFLPTSEIDSYLSVHDEQMLRALESETYLIYTVSFLRYAAKELR